MGKHRYEMSRHLAGGGWTIVVMDESGRELWAGSGYVTRAGARRAARKVLNAKSRGNHSGVQTVSGTL